jgi:hypothetical protein
MAKKKKKSEEIVENTAEKQVPEVKPEPVKPKKVLGFLINRTKQNQFVSYGKDKIMLSPNDRFPKVVNNYNLIDKDKIKDKLPKGVIFYPKD